MTNDGDAELIDVLRRRLAEAEEVARRCRLALDALEGGTRRRYAVTADRLADVLEAYEAGGVDAVINRLGVSRAQAYRLIGQARRNGPA